MSQFKHFSKGSAQDKGYVFYSVTENVANWLEETFGEEVKVLNFQSDLGVYVKITEQHETMLRLKFQL
jgi:hypothetical protein